ncbi:TetR/AcrR family transcriptional regulator [Muricauda sp. CAU 1633]|uniref:TetR/AcrR family transcriptional regulator n=1 Tax=Allomuricauda sp. CAU 1633 TaxID=2816036 RepID=UPI001A9059BF|nr:TetR/AcrR family transcriptional regulator [Muricauda sp. CAU 1633]MBO0321906.1 TetR/AcrR family transcriptional regulator [Muricauda sp. CAU 1633]
MIDTRERILRSALKLFNKYGTSNVTLRTIAKDLGISQGNLNYHFKKREDIINELYQRLVNDIDEIMLSNQQKEVSLKLLFDVSEVVTTNFYRYRFILLNFTEVMLEHRPIRNHFRDMVKLREEQMTALFSAFVEKGLMHNEQYPNQFQNLCRRFQILGDFWMSSAKVIHPKGLTKKSIQEYSGLLLEAIYPYLTSVGQEEFKQHYNKSTLENPKKTTVSF